MGKLAVALVMAIACGSMARADVGRRGSWDAVEGLDEGALIAVLPQSQAGADVCRVAAVSEAEVTCVKEGAARVVRLVFPRAAVRDVWVVEHAPERHIGRWIAVGIGFALGGAICAEAGPGAFFVCGTLGAGFVGAALEEDQRRAGFAGMWLPPAPRRPGRMRRRLLYRAP